MSAQNKPARLIVGIHQRGRPNDRLPVGIEITGENGWQSISAIWLLPQELIGARLDKYTGGSMRFCLPNGSTTDYFIDYICRATLLPELAAKANSTAQPA